jgi:hypothetical protein
MALIGPAGHLWRPTRRYGGDRAGPTHPQAPSSQCLLLAHRVVCCNATTSVAFGPKRTLRLEYMSNGLTSDHQPSSDRECCQIVFGAGVGLFAFTAGNARLCPSISFRIWLRALTSSFPSISLMIRSPYFLGASPAPTFRCVDAQACAVSVQRLHGCGLKP